MDCTISTTPNPLGEQLNEQIKLFYADKEELDKYKKSTDEYNKQIKDLMQQLNTNIFATDNGLIAKIIVQNRDSFIEDKLLLKLKELGITTPIKTIEVVDYSELENVIYNGQLDASELTNCKENKKVVTLKVSEKKGE